MGKDIPFCDNAQIGSLHYLYFFEQSSAHNETISLVAGCIIHMQRGCE